MIVADALTKEYGTKRALDGFTVRVGEGEIVGLLGANGSGKSTALRVLAGVLRSSSGSATLAGTAVRPANRVKLAPVLGYMPQQFSLYEDLTVRENLAFFAKIRGIAAPACPDLSLDSVLDVQARNLSHGWRQRLALLAVTLHAPRILLLDEPTAGVDSGARRQIWSHFRRFAGNGAALLLSTHAREDAARCDRLVHLIDGKAAATASPAEVLSDLADRE